jgi:hypothetical protein
MNAICELHRLFKPLEQQKVLRFWVNFIKDSLENVNEILQILRLCFHDILNPELVELASHPAVRANTPFIKYLTDNYDRKQLQVYGFDLDEPNMKPRLSRSRHDENSRYNNSMATLVEDFKNKESSDILNNVAKQAYQKTPEEKAEFYL